MKYVKIFDSQMRPLGVLQLGAELAQSEETKYVKVYDENLDKCNGVVALSDNISEADAAKNIKVYDENLNLVGGSTVSEIVGASEATIVSISPSLPTHDGITIVMSKEVSAEDVLNHLVIIAAGDLQLIKSQNQLTGNIEISDRLDVFYVIDTQGLPSDTIVLTDFIPDGGEIVEQIYWE